MCTCGPSVSLRYFGRRTPRRIHRGGHTYMSKEYGDMHFVYRELALLSLSPSSFVILSQCFSLSLHTMESTWSVTTTTTSRALRRKRMPPDRAQSTHDCFCPYVPRPCSLHTSLFVSLHLTATGALVASSSLLCGRHLRITCTFTPSLSFPPRAD